MLLITEYLEDTTQVTIEESSDGKKNLFLEGIFMQAEQKNRNGRIYPQSILEAQVNKYVETHVKTNRALGELNHPQSPQVNPKDASHRITSLKTEGNNFVGKALVLNTPNGNIVRGLLEGGTAMGVSSRGLGTVKSNKSGINEVQKDFRLVCVDVVADPSAPDAFVNGIMEGHEWVWNSGKAEKQIEKAKKLIMHAPARRIQEAKLEAFNKILTDVNINL